MGLSETEVEAFKILEESFSEEWRNEAYALVLDQVGKFIEKHKLRNTEFPACTNSALYILALGLAKKGLIFKPEEAENYLNEQLTRIRDGGFGVADKISKEIISIK